MQKINKTASFDWHQFTKYFDLDKLLANLTEKIIWIVIFSIMFIILRRIGRAIINRSFIRYRQKYQDTMAEKRISTFHTLTLNIFLYCLYFFWIYSILSTLGIPVGTLVASAGIFSLAIGLGAQGFVSDLVSGFFLLLEKQIEVGEYVQIGQIKGTVSAVGLRTTQVIGDDGTLNFIPNRTITIVSNMSRNNMTAMIQISILPETPIKTIKKIVQQVNDKNVPRFSDIIGQPNIIGALTLPNGKLVYQINIVTKNGAQGTINHTFLALYLEAIKAAGINLPASPTIIS